MYIYSLIVKKTFVVMFLLKIQNKKLLKQLLACCWCGLLLKLMYVHVYIDMFICLCVCFIHSCSSRVLIVTLLSHQSGFSMFTCSICLQTYIHTYLLTIINRSKNMHEYVFMEAVCLNESLLTIHIHLHK